MLSNHWILCVTMIYQIPMSVISMGAMGMVSAFSVGMNHISFEGILLVSTVCMVFMMSTMSMLVMVVSCAVCTASTHKQQHNLQYQQVREAANKKVPPLVVGPLRPYPPPPLELSGHQNFFC